MVSPREFETFYSEMVQFDRFLGMELEVHEPGKITYTLEVQQAHLTTPDQCHGGVISAMMDALLGVTALSWAVSKANLCSTVEFKTNYISPGRPGDLLVGTADIDFAGSRIIVASGNIVERNSNRLVAKGIGTFSQYPADRKKDVAAYRDKLG